ncbi:MAG TPA: hypothetical protein VEI03_06805 [Stellaceae bacterium]|nr:hypothetical protein [Stellaceae bacterium]
MNLPLRPAQALFLHSGFRSGSTWFWHRFRETRGTHAYYEPFHELLASLTLDALPRFGPQRWASGHPGMDAPYFTEYRDLLRPEGGVRLYQTRFAAEAYYETGPEEAQARYIRSLVDHAQDAGKVPVFGFCRSLGRVPWFRALGEGINIVTWRNPWDQWMSCRNQAAVQQNWYFLFRFVLFASFGGRHPRFAPFFAGLDLPPAPEGITTAQLGALLAYFEAADFATLFSVFLRVYMLDMLIALDHADYVVDLDALSADAGHRRDVTAALRALTGLADLSFEDCSLPRCEPANEAAYAARLEAALAFLTGAGAAIAGEYPRALPLLERRLAGCLRRPSPALA